MTISATALNAVSVNDSKREIREAARAKRKAQPDKDELSRAICRTFAGLSEYQAAETILYYLDVRDEVRTRHDLPAALARGKRIIVPYCAGGRLELFHLESLEELAVGKFGILEPRPELRELAAKRVEIAVVDLVMAPGVAFDRRGGRLGHGLGYYDKLLEGARPDAPIVALAFECQMFAEIPTQAHDVRMDRIVTERGVHDCRIARASDA